ncbi:MAG: indole-3-glycerol-phosphate synthase [Promethearchaeota archaeon]
MPNILDEIIANRKVSLPEQYVPEDLSESIKSKKKEPLSETIKRNQGISIISEIKPASPSLGDINIEIDVVKVAKQMEQAGVVGISILTEPNYFKGSFSNLKKTAENTSIPLLMKDFIFSELQLKIASDCGASNILLINKLGNLENLYKLALDYHLEPLIEIHNKEEIKDLINLKDIGFNPKLVGVNNRELESMKIDLNTSKTIIPEIKKILGNETIVISESGIYENSDINNLMPYSADGFLIGSSIIQSKDIKKKILNLRGLL